MLKKCMALLTVVVMLLSCVPMQGVAASGVTARHGIHQLRFPAAGIAGGRDPRPHQRGIARVQASDL